MGGESRLNLDKSKDGNMIRYKVKLETEQGPLTIEVAAKSYTEAKRKARSVCRKTKNPDKLITLTASSIKAGRHAGSHS